MIQSILNVLKYAWKDIADAVIWFFSMLIRIFLFVLSIGMIILIVGQVYSTVFLSRQDYKDITQWDAFAQTSYIQDRNGKQLYGFFEEDREYVSLDSVSNTLIQAIISAEDKTFRSNPWYDLTAIARAAKNNFSQLMTAGQIRQLQWGSTITQQLIKNVNLWNQKTLQRKINEVILAKEFTDILTDHVRTRNPEKTSGQQFYLAKKYVLELYLNYIFLGNHSYGVESASKKYFGKSSSELSIGESSIIASIPKAPSTYDPYTNTKKLMWHWTLEENSITKVLPTSMHPEIKNLLLHQLSDNVTREMLTTTLAGIKENNAPLEYFFTQLAKITIKSEESILELDYTLGRKDYVLGQMYLNNHITANQLIEAFVETIDQEFLPVHFPIKAPHFVYWVRDLLLHDEKFKDLNITEQKLSKWWYTIKTTLDYDMQTQIEQHIANNNFLLEYHNGNNRAILITNPEDWGVSVYLWSSDFRNDEIEGKNDLVKSLKQPWSTVKPFVYAYSMTEFELGPESKVIDNKFRVGDYEPQNADGKFRGMTTLAKALAWSRNIPALKLFDANGWEAAMKPYLKKLGFTSLDDDHEYWLSLAIWWGESNMLQLAQAYSELAHSGSFIPWINPILEIRDAEWKLLYDHRDELEKNKDTKERLIPLWASRLVWNILSQSNNAPSGWYNMLNIPSLQHYAIKTGTSDKKVLDEFGNKETRPKDGRLVFYTPNTVITMRAGNTDGSAMNEKAFGWTLNAPLLQDIVKTMVEQEYMEDENMYYPTDQITNGRYISPVNNWRPASITK